jgi:hypothetical protein
VATLSNGPMKILNFEYLFKKYIYYYYCITVLYIYIFFKKKSSKLRIRQLTCAIFAAVAITFIVLICRKLQGVPLLNPKHCPCPSPTRTQNARVPTPCLPKIDNIPKIDSSYIILIMYTIH